MITVSASNVSFCYRQDVPVIRGLSFSVSSGDILAVLGPNGAGKTTFLRCVTGFLRWTSGSLLLDGTDAARIPAKQFWRRVSYVPQVRSSGAQSSMTAEEMILLGKTGQYGLFSSPGRDDLLRTDALMDELGISHLRGRRCAELSGGELQMVLIARALLPGPELLILDEPESGLDFRNQLTVLDTIRRLSAEGMCCIFNTHYPDHALSLASHALLLPKGGETCRFGPVRDVVTEEALLRVFGVRTAIRSFEEDGRTCSCVLPLSLS